MSGSVWRVFAILLTALLVPACGSQGDTIVIIQSSGNGTGGGSEGSGPFTPGAVFVADKVINETFELFSANFSGTRVENLSGPLAAGGNVLDFAWSPDRQWVAFRAYKEATQVLDLYVVPAAGGTPVKVNGASNAGDKVGPYTWSPNSSRLAFARRRIEIAPGFFIYTDVVICDPNGSNLAVNPAAILLDDGVKWSPDSSRLAFECIPGGGYFEIGVVLSNGTGFTQVSAAGPTGDATTFSWAPDTSRLAYMAQQSTPGVVELYTSFPDGTGNVKVNGALAGGGNVTKFAWAPDSSRIAYLADQTTDTIIELYSSIPDGTGNVKVNGALVAGGNVTDYAWAPDSSRIGYVADQDTDEVFELYTSLPDGTGNLKVNGALTAGGGVGDFAWAPDSSKIAYTADQDTVAVWELYISKPDGTGNVKVSPPIASGVGIYPSSWAWAPDGSRLGAATYQISSVLELFTCLPDGSGASKVSGTMVPGGTMTLVGPGIPPLWSSDSSRLVYVATQIDQYMFELFASFPTTAAGNVRISGAAMNPSGDVQIFQIR